MFSLIEKCILRPIARRAKERELSEMALRWQGVGRVISKKANTTSTTCEEWEFSNDNLWSLWVPQERFQKDRAWCKELEERLHLIPAGPYPGLATIRCPGDFSLRAGFCTEELGALLQADPEEDPQRARLQLERRLGALVVGSHTLHLRGCKKVGLTPNSLYLQSGRGTVTWFPGQAPEKACDCPSDSVAIQSFAASLGYDKHLAGWNTGHEDSFASFMECVRPNFYWRNWKDAVGLASSDFESWALSQVSTQSSLPKELGSESDVRRTIRHASLPGIWGFLLALAKWTSVGEKQGMLFYQWPLASYLFVSIEPGKSYQWLIQEPPNFEGDAISGTQFWVGAASSIFVDRYSYQPPDTLSPVTVALMDIVSQMDAEQPPIERVIQAWEAFGNSQPPEAVAS